MRATLARLPIRPRYRRSRAASARIASRSWVCPRVTTTTKADAGSSARCSHSAIGSATTSSAAGKRSALANFSRSSTTWTRKPASRGDAAEVTADVAGADDVEVRGRVRADRCGRPSGLRRRARSPGRSRRSARSGAARPAGGQRLARLPERVVLVAAAADRADRPAVREDEHLRAGALRRRAARADDGHERDRFAALAARPPPRRGLPRSDQHLDLRPLLRVLDERVDACRCFFCSLRNSHDLRLDLLEGNRRSRPCCSITLMMW